MTLAPKPETPSFTPPSVPPKDTDLNLTKTLSRAASSDFRAPSRAVPLSAEDVDEELDQLLTLAKPLCPVPGVHSVNVESPDVMKG